MKQKTINWYARDVLAALERYDPTGRGLATTELAAVSVTDARW